MTEFRQLKNSQEGMVLDKSLESGTTEPVVVTEGETEIADPIIEASQATGEAIKTQQDTLIGDYDRHFANVGSRPLSSDIRNISDQAELIKLKEYLEGFAGDNLSENQLNQLGNDADDEGSYYQQFCYFLLDQATVAGTTTPPLVTKQPSTSETLPDREDVCIKLTSEEQAAYLNGLPAKSYNALKGAAEVPLYRYDSKIKQIDKRYTDLDSGSAQSLQFLIEKSSNTPERKKSLSKALNTRADNKITVGQLVCAINDPDFKLTSKLPDNFNFAVAIGHESTIPSAISNLPEKNNATTEQAGRFAGSAVLILLLTTDNQSPLEANYEALREISQSQVSFNRTTLENLMKNTLNQPLARLQELLDILKISKDLSDRIWEAVLVNEENVFALNGIKATTVTEKPQFLTVGNFFKGSAAVAAITLLGPFILNSTKNWSIDTLAQITEPQTIVLKKVPEESNSPDQVNNNKRIKVSFTDSGAGEDDGNTTYQYPLENSKNNFRLSNQLNSKTDDLKTFLNTIGHTVNIDVKTVPGKDSSITLTIRDGATKEEIQDVENNIRIFEAMVNFKQGSKYFLPLDTLYKMDKEQLKKKIKEFNELGIPLSQEPLITGMSSSTTRGAVPLNQLIEQAKVADGRNIANTGYGLFGGVVVVGAASLAALKASKNKKGK